MPIAALSRVATMDTLIESQIAESWSGLTGLRAAARSHGAPDRHGSGGDRRRRAQAAGGWWGHRSRAVAPFRHGRRANMGGEAVSRPTLSARGPWRTAVGPGARRRDDYTRGQGTSRCWIQVSAQFTRNMRASRMRESAMATSKLPLPVSSTVAVVSTRVELLM